MSDNIEVSQRAREAAADLLDQISSLLDHNGIGQVADLIRDGEYDDHEATLAFAHFEADTRALNPGVGEGLREALEANISSMEEQVRRCARWGKSHNELDAAIEETRQALAKSPPAAVDAK